jgi:gliding motility-associated-like protein
MKRIDHKSIMNKCIFYVLFALLSIQGYAQCGTETFTVVDWCENGYAEWTVNNPVPGARYHWYEPVYAADGITITDTIDRGFGTNPAGSHFVSPYRYTTPAGPLSPGWDERKFWYVRETMVTGFINNSANGGIVTGGPTQATGYTMSVTANTEIHYNYLSVPVILYNSANTFSIQLQIGTKFTQRYEFTAGNTIPLGSQAYLVAIPVDITMPVGTYSITVITNPAGIPATSNPVDGLLWANDDVYTGSVFTNTGITSATGGIQNIWGGNRRSLLYNWDYIAYCPYEFSDIAKKETDLTKCCTPVTAGVIISSSNPIIVSGTSSSLLSVVSYTSTSNYFQWYKDNSPIAGEGGVGNTSITVTTPGSYSVREVEDPVYLDNISCYMDTLTLVQERALFAKLNNPKVSYCVGDKVTIEAYGASIGNVSWSPASLAANPNSKITDVTLSATGTLTFTATADLFPDDLILDGDFENFDPTSPAFQTDMLYIPVTSTWNPNRYTVNDYVPNTSYWNTDSPFNAATQTRGDGNFLISDGPTVAGSLIWKQTVPTTTNKDYTFSIDHVNICWNGSADPWVTGRIAENDLEFNVFINGTLYGSYKTDGRGEYAGVGRWKTDHFVWNSGGATQAVIEIKTKNTGTAGYDFGFDNIRFGGPQTQTATVSVGPILDCYDVVATQSACTGTDKILSAKAINTSTGEEVGVIDHWEIIPGNTIAGSGKTITVSPPVTTTYVAYGYFPGGNLIQNGDFELGANGFNHGSANGLYNLTTTPGPGSIAILKNPQTETGNIAYANMGDHTSGTGNMLLVDPGSADGNIISYNFNANANQNYLFSLWAANAVNFSQNPNGISASLSFIINGPGITDLQITSIDLPRNNTWIQLSHVWKPVTTGAYTLTVRAKGDATLAPIQSAETGQSINGGNDYVLDDIVLAEPTSKVYTDTIVVTPCVTCTQPTTVTITAPAAAADTICQGSTLTLTGTVTVPAASSAAGGFKYSWIKAGATPATDVVLQTASITPTTGSPSAVPDYIITGALTAAGKYILRVEDGTTNSSSCFLDDTLTLVVDPTTVPGTISDNQEICSGTIPAALTGTISIGGTTSKNYKWESSLTGTAPWTQESLYSTSATGFAPAALTATTHFRRIDSSGVCASVSTDTIVIRVNNKPILSALIPVLRDTLCAGEDFNISTTIALTDSTGVHASSNGGYYFYWKKYQAGVLQSATAALPYRDLFATTKSAAVIDSGMYYLIVQDGIGATKCKDSVGVHIIINQAPTSKGLISAHQEICLGDASAPFSEVRPPLGHNTTVVYKQWYTTEDTAAAPPVLTKLTGQNSTAYNAGLPVKTMYYVRKDSVQYCEAVATNFLKIRVNNSVVADTIMPIENDTLCEAIGSMFQLKGVVDSLAKSSINNGYYFTWMKLQEPSTIPVVVGTPGVYADFPPVSRLAVEADSGTYYLIIQDGAGATLCQDTIKTKVVVYKECTLLPPPCVKPVSVSAILTGKDTLCVGNNFTLRMDDIDTSAGPASQKYYFSWRRINNAGSVLLAPPSATYSDLILTNVTQADSGRYYLVVQDGIDSGPACKDSSDVISIVINAPIITPPVIAASDTICEGSVPALFIGTDVASHYQWYISTDSFKTVPESQLIVGAVSDSYQSGALSATSYYIRRDSIAACPAVNSNIITIQVDKPVVPGVVGNDTVVCSGSPILEFKEITAASGGSGTFTYQWQSSADNVTFEDIIGATNNVYQSPDILSRTYFRRIDSSGVCGSKITDTIFVDAVTGVNPGIVSGTSPTICYNTVPTVSFVNIAGASNGSGGPGSETYQWQISPDNTYWTDIDGATGLTYTETNPLTDTMYYRREVGMGPGTCDTSYTESLAINVYAPFVVGSIPADLTVCEGTSVTINELTQASGGGEPNSQIYEWIESLDKGNTWTTSSGISNQADYTTPVLTDSIWFRRVVTVECNKDTSNIMKIHVDSINTVDITMSDVSSCSGTDVTFAPVYSGEGLTPLFEWYKGESAAGPWTPVAGNTSYTIINPQTSDNGFYRVVLKSSFVCNSGDAENVAELTVNGIVVPLVSVASDPAGPICDTTVSVTYTATAVQGDAGAATYQWYDGVTGLPIPSETGITYTPATKPSIGDQVYVVMTSDITCANPVTATSSKIILDVRVTPDPVIISKDTTVCTPAEVILTASNITSGSNQFKWYKDGVLLTNADQINYIVTVNDFPGGKYTFVEDNGVCSTESDTVTVSMLQSPSANAGSDITAVEGETISLHGSVSNNTTSYTWIPGGGLNNANILNPDLVVPGATVVYTLVAYNNTNGQTCSSSDAVTIIVERRIVIPNVITVNGDGVNDTWYIENMENFPDAEVLIYNRWGNLVWQSNGYLKEWDGTNYRNGEVLADGTYFYIIDLHSVKVKDSYTGWVQIVK